MILIINEFKKIMSVKSLLLSIFGIICFCIFTLISSFHNYGMYDSTGQYKIGYDMVLKNRSVKEELNGILTDDKLKECITSFKAILSNKNNYDSSGNLVIKNIEDTKKMALYSDLADLLTRVYSPLNTFDPNVMMSLNVENIKVDDIFINRSLNIKTVLQSSDFEDHLRNINTVEYGYAQGWQSLFDDLYQISIFIFILIAIFISPVFTRENRHKTAALLYTSKYGKTKVISSKLISSFVISSAIYFVTVFGYSLVKLSIFGFEGSNVIIQLTSAYWLSLFPMTFFQGWVFILLLGYISTLLTTSVCLYISMLFKKDYFSIILNLLIILVPIVLSGNSYLSDFFKWFPSKMINYPTMLLSFDNITILKNEINIVYLQIFILFLITFILIILIKRVMIKKKIAN